MVPDARGECKRHRTSNAGAEEAALRIYILAQEIVDELEILRLGNRVVVASIGKFPPDLGRFAYLEQTAHMRGSTIVSTQRTRDFPPVASLRNNLIFETAEKQDWDICYLRQRSF